MIFVEVPVPAHFASAKGSRRFVRRMLMNRDHVVLVGELPSGWRHLWIARQSGEPVSWKEKQEVKNAVVGVDALAIEAFPPAAELLDTANIYHLFVAPPGFKLPFSLEPEV